MKEELLPDQGEGMFRWEKKYLLQFLYSTEMEQTHLFSCKYLIGKNEILTYIPDYQDLFLEDIDAQVYTSRIMNENCIRMKHLEDQVNKVDIL